jgi:hypothetical protein
MAKSPARPVELPLPSRKKIPQSDFHLTEGAQTFFTCHPAIGTTKEDLLIPELWSHCARIIRPMSEIRVMPKGGAFYARLLVLHATPTEAFVHLLEYHDLDKVDPRKMQDDKYKIDYDSVQEFHILRRSDKVVVHANMRTRREALAWLDEQPHRAA